MAYEFTYGPVTTYEHLVELEELGNVAIEVIDSELYCYYLVIRTELGQASILEYGPIVPDSQLLPSRTTIIFERITFDERRISQVISRFLYPRNKGKNTVEAVHIIDVDTALDRGINLLEYMRGFSAGTNY